MVMIVALPRMILSRIIPIVSNNRGTRSIPNHSYPSLSQACYSHYMKREHHEHKGVLRLNEGFGYVELEGVDSAVPDVYIPGSELGAAMDGDRVVVVKAVRQGRDFGRIVKILDRATNSIVGTIDIRGHEPVLINERATEPIRIDLQNSTVKRAEIRPGVRAVVEITTYPTEHLSARGRLVRILGEAGTPAVELEASRFNWNVPVEFPADVQAAARALPDEVSRRDIEGRIDLRNHDVFTIDPTDARDFDDAISLEHLSGSSLPPRRNPKAVWRVGVHIADVSHYIPEGTALDREAYNRATSTYLPGQVIPMLPERLSNGICSLVEGQERLTVSVFFELDLEFRTVGAWHGRSVIRSKRRFTYDEVDVILDMIEAQGAPAAGSGNQARLFHTEISGLKRVAQMWSSERMGRGAIDLDRPEEKPVLDLHGKVIAIKRIDRTWSHRLIEELMIRANEYVAQQMKKHGIFRVHDAPDPEKLMRLRRMASIIGGGPTRGSVQKILIAFRDSPAKRIIEYLALRTMQEAKYSSENTGHFGLASDAYSHFTSPIRRYPDLLAHRIILGIGTKHSLAEAARHTSRREREAMEAERDALRIKYLEYAEQHLGETVMGWIDNVSREGLFVTLDFGPRGLIPAAELGREEFRFERDALSLVGRRTGKRYKVGDEIEVILAAIDIAHRELFLSLSRTAGESRMPVKKSSPHTPAERDRARARHGKPGRKVGRLKIRHKRGRGKRR